MADYSGFLYHPTSGLPLIGVKTQSFNATTGVLISTVYTDSTGKWDFGALSVIPTIYAYTEFGIRLVFRGEIVGTIGANVDVVSGGAFRANATAILTGDGFYTAYNAGVPVLRIGTVSGGALVKGVYWDGSNLAWIGVNTSLTAAGLFTAANAVITGTITASAGSIGGWTINATYLAKDTGVDATSAGMAPLDYPFYGGATYANRATAPFRVTPAGALVATSATITGAITASSGSFSGVMNIGADGGIFQGTGTFASPTTALKIYNSGGVGLLEMWGGGVKQVYFGTDGKLYAGGGGVKLDSSGIGLTTVPGNNGIIMWRNTTPADVGYLKIEYQVGSGVTGDFDITTYQAAEDAQITLTARAGGGGQTGRIQIYQHPSNPADSLILFRLNSADLMNLTSTALAMTGALTATSYISSGDSPAASGQVRLPNAAWITGRNAANGADVNMIQVNASDLIAFGAAFGAVPTLPTQTANYGFFGPVSGGAAVPAFRALVAADMPSGIVDLTAVDFLVGTATALLSGEIVVGPTPGGELGGTWASPTVDTIHSGSAHHAAVNLAVSADVLLGLSTQELSLDTQAANLLLAGPASGAAAAPTFRAMVVDDLVAHGAAQHTDITRYIWLPPRVFGAMVGTPVLVTYGTATDLADAWAFDVDTIERIGTAFVLPSDWAGGAITVKFYWANDTDTNVAHICTWGAGWSSLSDGDALNLARERGVQLGATVPSATARIEDIFTVGSSATGLVAGDLIRFYALRNAAAVEDNMTGDALLLGVLIEYTANQ